MSLERKVLIFVRTNRNSLLHRMLTRVLFSTRNELRARKSKFEYGAIVDAKDHSTIFTLSLLGILHGLFGLVLTVDGMEA